MNVESNEIVLLMDSFYVNIFERNNKNEIDLKFENIFLLSKRGIFFIEKEYFI